MHGDQIFRLQNARSSGPGSNPRLVEERIVVRLNIICENLSSEMYIRVYSTRMSSFLYFHFMAVCESTNVV